MVGREQGKDCQNYPKERGGMMGCDGYIKRTDEPVEVELVCYVCGRKVQEGAIPDDTIHNDCIDPDFGLRVDVNILNYEGR